jgi:hypothetical protein
MPRKHSTKKSAKRGDKRNVKLTAKKAVKVGGRTVARHTTGNVRPPAAFLLDQAHGPVNPKPRIRKIYDSPNKGSRQAATIQRIILHVTTSRNVESTLSWFMDQKSQRSAHYVIDRNGDIYQCVPDSEKAYHAKADNANSIGIEHVGLATDTLAGAQEAASVALIKWLLAEYGFTPAAIFGHRFTPANIGTTECPDRLFGAPTEQAISDWVSRNF